MTVPHLTRSISPHYLRLIYNKDSTEILQGPVLRLHSVFFKLYCTAAYLYYSWVDYCEPWQVVICPVSSAYKSKPHCRRRQQFFYFYYYFFFNWVRSSVFGLKRFLIMYLCSSIWETEMKYRDIIRPRRLLKSPSWSQFILNSNHLRQCNWKGIKLLELMSYDRGCKGAENFW